MRPTCTLAGIRNSRITRQLDLWAERNGTGFATGSSTGFLLPNGARRSPDAAWTARARVAQLDPSSRNRYWHLCPDFVIELHATTDRVSLVREKMQEWVATGARLAWLINSEAKSVKIYRADGTVEVRQGIDAIEGEGPMAGFVLDLEGMESARRIAVSERKLRMLN